MKIYGKKIAIQMSKLLKKRVKKLKKRKLKLVTFLVKEAPDQLSFVKIKAKQAKKLGIDFELVSYKKAPFFQELITKIREKAIEEATTGVIVQQPLPAQLQTNSIYDFIPLNKEIEGHKRKTTFFPPLGLAVLTIIKYVFSEKKKNKDLFIDPINDKLFFKMTLKNKQIILVGRGITGGNPIGKTLREMKINYIGINSKTPNPESYYENADIIITAVGKKVIKPEYLKKGVVLINVGVRKENGKLLGDYDEKEVRKVASFYTPTPKGIGPIDVVYLYKNLIDACGKVAKKIPRR